ncbi:MAG: hypothetical protein V8S22_00990 [Lachnospiraceae bacterium]
MYLVVILQAVISVSVDMLPLPGGVGVSEGLFMTMFEPVFGEKLLPGYAVEPRHQLLRVTAHQCSDHLLCTPEADAGFSEKKQENTEENVEREKE